MGGHRAQSAFQALVGERRRFTVRATAFYTGYLVAFLALLGFAPDFMAKEVLGRSRSRCSAA